MDEDSKPSCKYDDCDRDAKSRDMCNKHYMRWWTSHGDPCEVEGCGKTQYARGWCGMHYQRWRTEGDVGEPEPRFMQNATVEERFWAKVDKKGPDDCWLWTAATFSGGYGQFSIDGEVVGAHRVAYELEVGEIPDGMQIDHLCHTEAAPDCEGGTDCQHRPCVNPAHLEPVTHAENIGRGWRAQKTECKRGHDLTDPDNLKPNSRGARQCRKCSNISRRKRYRRLGK